MSAFKLRKEKDCLNCGHVVEENFCPHCGQENIVVKEDAFHMVTHAIADYFHFEHKFFGTIKPLLLKPGQLTSSYVAGKRVSFIHPIRLYIFVSIVFFLVVLSGTKFDEDNSDDKVKPKASTTKIASKSKTKDTALTAAEIKEIEAGLRFVPNANGLRDSILKQAKQNKADESVKFGSRKKKGKFSTGWTTTDTTVADYEKHQAALPKNKRDGFFKHYVIKRNIELDKYDNPGTKLLEDFVHNIPKMMFLLLPMFALILKLVYINKNKYYYEHLIYSFHLHSAIFLSILITMLFQWLFKFVYDISGWFSFLCIIYIIWYIYRSLRAFYNSTRWVTILKMFFLSFCYTIVLSICFLIVIAISFAMV